MRDMRVVDVFQKVMKGELTWWEAERVLGYTARHIRRLRTTLLKDGVESVRDKRAGRRMPNGVPKETVSQILELRTKTYAAFNLKHFQHWLRKKHGIDVSYTYLRTLLQRAGLYHGGQPKGTHRKRRERRPCRGMMLHIDGSEHAWLGEGHGKRDLILIQDDADSRVLYGRIVPEEGTKTCLEGLLHVLETYGLFSELYSDRGSHFALTKKAGGQAEAGDVQIARILKGLKIWAIYAYSPQARGRSERTFGTFQGRLVNELAVAGITDWDEANRYLNDVFIPDYNELFTVEPLQPHSAFLSTEKLDLKRACALEHKVTVGKDNCVRWKRRCFQIPPNDSRPTYARCKATLVEFLSGDIHIEYGPLTIARFDSEGKPLIEKTQKRRKPKPFQSLAAQTHAHQPAGHL